ncbi:TPA: hypothetical protein ACMDVE_004643, partial [Vibrio parahaemolyticus]
KLKSGAVSTRLSLKPLGIYNAVENGLTTPTSAFKQTMLQSSLSTHKSVSATVNPSHKNNRSEILTTPKA